MSTRAAVTVGIDGSESARNALNWAIEYARGRGLPLRIITSLDVPLARPRPIAYPLTELRAEATRDAQVLLARAVDHAQSAAPELDVEEDVSAEPPIPALLKASAESGLVVVGCRGLNPLQGVLLGSVSTAVSAHATCPVVVVRSERRPGAGTPVVVGVDGSDHDAETLAAAFEAADAWGAGLTVVHAWSELALVAPFGGAAAEWVSWEEQRDEAAERVAKALAGWAEKYPAVPVTSRVVRDEPGQALRKAGYTAGLLVVGSHGRGGFTGMLLGSVARRLVHHADCPVMVVRARKPVLAAHVAG